MKKWLIFFVASFFIISCDLISEVDEVVVDLKKVSTEIDVEEVVVSEIESSDENKDVINIEETETDTEETGSEKEKNNTDSDFDSAGEEVIVPEIQDFDGNNVSDVKDRLWTIFVYMSADNQLESAAIEDLCEMQNSIINDEEVTIVALVDRSNRYNTSNGDWTGTKLYRIRTGKKVSTSEILSEELDCRPLGLSVGTDTELEMASNYTLSNALSYVMTKFPAEKYGLVMWGHGTGWRDLPGESAIDCSEHKSSFKGFAFDESSGTYMTLKQLGTALKTSLDSNKLNFIGFDTCFSGEIEVAYELRNCAKYFVGSEGLVSSSGWDYKKVFDYFYSSEDLSEENLCKSIVTQFSEQYSCTPRASICAVKTDGLESYLSAFNSFCSTAGKSIKTMKVHDELLGLIYTNPDCPTEKYSYGAAGYDIYLDIESLVDNITSYFSTTILKKLSKNLKTTQDELYVDSWASDRNTGGLGVYFSTYAEGGVLVSNHPSGYISGKIINQIDFVLDCPGYVPAKTTSTGLLDSLFYRDFS